MNTNSTTYKNMMILPLPLSIHHHHQLSLSNGFYRTSSYYPHIHEQILENQAYIDQKSCVKQHSFDPSSTHHLSYTMQEDIPNDTTIGVPSPLCSVCGDISTGIHFGGNSCESCKAFFRRSVQCLRFQNYKCSNEERCPVNIVTRKVCQFCRYTKCVAIGMKPKWVLSDQEREEKYGARRKCVRVNRPPDEDPDIHKYLTPEEKLLIEDIARALYQSRATYPLSFPNPSVLHANPAESPAPSPASQSSTTSEKPPSAPANLLIVPIQRLVLFARMLKDFDLFSEDDKVGLLKGAAIEIMVCSSNTLFNPKTHTFTNYLSRDQRAVVDDQILSLDPIFMKLWGEEIFLRTRSFLISMCNLQIDEIASTLLVPIILFSPDRSNIKDLQSVQRLQEKYAMLLRKYMNWRYGNERTDIIYPKLLLQVVALRSLGLAHGEIIKGFMASSSVNPLVQEIIIKPEMLARPLPKTADSVSFSSSPPPDIEMLDSDKTPSNDTESPMGSDEDDSKKKKQRASIDDEFDFDNDDLDGSDPRNIWRKRRKFVDPYELLLQAENEIKISNNNQMKTTNEYKNVDKYPQTNCLYMKPFDHQVPTSISVPHDDVMTVTTSGYSMPNPYRQFPMKEQSFVASPESIQQLQELYRVHSSSSTGDLSSYDYQSRASPTRLPTSEQYYDDQTYGNYPQYYANTPTDNYQQQQTEQQLLHLSLASNQSETSPGQTMINIPSIDHQSQSTSNPTLDEDEQQLLDAIHAHPNKRDLVLNLLRQMNQPNSSPRHEHHRSDPSAQYKP